MELVFDCTEVEGVVISQPFERQVKVLLDRSTQDVVKDISITMGVVAPRSRNDLHSHKGTEILYITTGYGKAVVGDREYAIKANHLIIAPPGVMHQQINQSDETMRMFAIWTPYESGEDVLKRALEAAAKK